MARAKKGARAASAAAEAAGARQEVMAKLARLGTKVGKEIGAVQAPVIEIPIRGRSNVAYDAKTGLLMLGDKMLKRNFLNIAHSKKFMQTLLVGAYCYDELLRKDLHCTSRDLFYAFKRTLPRSDENIWDEQRESDPCIVDLEVALDTLRERLHINANPKGKVIGPATVVDRYAGETVEIDWAKMGSGGWGIPSNVENLQFKDVGADYVLVVEKFAAFDRLNEDKFWRKNNCIIITTEGQGGRGTRRLIQRLAREAKLQVVVLSDADGYGWYIYSVIKSGSMALAHTSDRLGTPEARFVGLTLSDVEKYGLEKQLIKAEDVDLKRTREIMDYDWFKAKAWQAELRKALEMKKKAEIEALTAKSLQFISKTYLPEKIESKDFMP